MSPKETLAAWNRQLDSARGGMLAGGGKPGVSSLEQLAGKPAGDAKLLSGELPFPYMAETMDFALVEVAHGLAVFQSTPQLKHFNPLGTVHGGWFATLLDSALGCAVHTTLPAGSGFTTAQLNIHMVRAATLKTGRCGP